MGVLENIWDKFLANPERNSKIMAVIFLFQLIPIVYPLGIPVPFTVFTKDQWAMFEGGTMSYGREMPGMQPGEIILWGNLAESAGGYNTGRDAFGAYLMQALGEKGCKLIMARLATGAGPVFLDVIRRYLDTNYPGLMVYGENYVISEYMPGREAAVKYVAEQLGSIKDMFGNAINSYPGFSHVNDINDIQYSWGTVERTTDHDIFIRQWGTEYPNHEFAMTGAFAIAAPYYGGIITSLVGGGVELQAKLLSHYGKAHFAGEQLVTVEVTQLGILTFIPLLIWGFYVNWRRALREGVSLTPRVGERGQ
jgi:hypothetical protein